MTQDELKSLLHYNPTTGIFTWLVSNGPRAKIGSIAGGINSDGYRLIKINGKKYKEHRLAWLYVHGHFPVENIDHRDGKRSNNAIDNLREATVAQNNQNICKPKHNSSGLIGVCFHKLSNKWSSSISINSKQKHLGLFATPEEAHQAYLKAKAELHTFNPVPR